MPGRPGQKFIDRLTTPQTGRAYGLEFLLRRAGARAACSAGSRTRCRAPSAIATARGRPTTTIARTCSTSSSGVPLRRNWDIGLRVQYQSGQPATTTAGYNTARADGYVRFDVRVDKRAVWQTWLLDFYVDITNVALLPEEVTPGQTIRYVLPTLGLRGRF